MESFFDLALPKFKERVLPIKYRSRGILTIEGFFVCSYANLYNIDCMIDSGTKNGMSTQIFAKFGIPTIMSIDKNQRQNTMDRLKGYENINFIEGDDYHSILGIIRSKTFKRIGILIDSTKGEKGCKYLSEFWDYDNVMFAGLHDQVQYNYIMSKYFNGVRYSDNYDFWKKYGNLSKKDIKALKKHFEEGKVGHTDYKEHVCEIDFSNMDDFRGFSIGMVGK